MSILSRRIDSAMQSVTKWVSPCTTAIARSCSCGSVMVQTAPSFRNTSSRAFVVAGAARAGQAMMICCFNDETVGPNIGWRPITSAFDFSIAFTGPAFSDVRSQRSWPFCSSGAISSMTRTVSRMGTETITRSHASAISRLVIFVDLPETMTS